MDEDALVAACDLIERTGARQLEVGFLDQDAPVESARWYAKVLYRGRVRVTEDHPGPAQAVEALAGKLLEGGRCVSCGDPISLAPGEGCHWSRTGRRWEAGCENVRLRRVRKRR